MKPSGLHPIQRKHLATLEKLAKNSALASVAKQVARPSIRLRVRAVKKSAFAVGGTRLGGPADLPKGMSWPTAKGQALTFVGQISLAEVKPFDGEHLLPTAGILSFFVRGKTALVRHLTGSLERTVTNALAEADELVGTGVDLAPSMSLPPAKSPAVAKLSAADRTAYAALVHAFDRWSRKEAKQHEDAEHVLLGQGVKDDVVLFRFAGSATMGESDHDALSFVIDRASLAKGDFAKTRIA